MHSKICLEEYASTLSELNTFISALCKELGKVSFGGTSFKSLMEIKDIFAADLLGYLKNYGVSSSFKRLKAQSYIQRYMESTQISLVVLSNKYINCRHEYSDLKNNFPPYL